MKRTRQYVMIMATVAAFLCWTGPGGTAWGQAYRNGYVTSDGRMGLRRGNATSTGSKGYIGNANNVNNEFGAGESAIVNTSSVTFPTPAHALKIANPTALRVGSEYSQNVVINIYDNGGNAAGRIINVHFKDYTKTASPGTWGAQESEDRMFFSSLQYDATTDVGNVGLFTGGSGSTAPPTPAGAVRLGIAQAGGVPYYGSVFSAVKKNDSTAVFPIHNHVSGWDKQNFKIKISGMSDLVYTSLVNQTTNQDDGKILHYIIPTDQPNGFGNYHTLVPAANGGPVTAASYVRPTTVMVGGTHTFDLLRMSDIGWWVMPKHGTIDPASTQNHGGHIFNSGSCTHFSGYVYYQTQTASFVDKGAYQILNAYVNGAIRFLGDSYTCVKDSAENAAQHSQTFLVVPDNKHYGLRVGGNFQKFQWHVEGTAAENNTGMYSASGSPAFPTTNVTDIYLQKGSSGAWSATEKNWGTLATNLANNISLHLASYDVKGGIFGVNGKYDAGNATFHTAESSSAPTGNNHAVIEVGVATNATYNKFHVYSGGTFKNFRSTCATPTCQAIDMNTAPTLTINDTEPLNILNDGGSGGSCCADILLRAAGAAAISNALNGSQTGTGALHVQALGAISATGNITMDASGSGENNNVAFISQLSNINLAGLEYKGGPGASAGHDANLTVWAQGIPGGCGGYVHATGDVKVTSQQTTNSFKNLIKYVPDNSSYLRYGLYCDDHRADTMKALTNLTTPLQTRIQSDNDYVRVEGDFGYEGKKGALLVQGLGDVTFDKKAEIKFTDEGDAAIQSRSGKVTVGDAFNYESTHTVNDLFVDGVGGVYFNGGGKIDMSHANTSNVGIQSNAGNVSFSGASKIFDVKFTGSNKGDLDIWAGKNVLFNIPFTSTENNDKINSRVYAGNDILSAPNAHVSFLSTNDNNSTLTWVARRNITTNGILTASYTGTHTGIMAFQAAGGNITTNKEVRVSTENTNYVLFSAEMLNTGCSVLNGGNSPYTDCTPGNRNSMDGNIYWNDSVTITRTVTSNSTTDILAMNNIRTNQVGITNAAAKDTTNVTSYMGDIWLGYSNPTSATTTSNRFTYTGTGDGGMLNIKAGFQDVTNTNHDGGGNIYFTALRGVMAATKKHIADVRIPFSNEYICGSSCDSLLHNRSKGSMMRYEHSGIIGGLGACHRDKDIASYNLIAQGTPSMVATDTSLVYLGNMGDLTLDAGKRGNIIMNRGALLNYQGDKGNATFRTREGDIDMRDPFDAKKMKGGLLFLAQLENLGDLEKIGICGCNEERNNVYLQDFEYKAEGNSGSVFVGADNNIKLNYGGLTNIGTRQDPFLSTDYEEKDGYILKKGRGYKKNGGCDTYYHCDLNNDENQARPLVLNFGGTVTSGGFAAVASDMIDVYKDLIYTGGRGSGLSAVPGTGTLHGENVAGYGLFMKTQGNKANWTDNILLQAPKCPTTCQPSGCDVPGRKPSGFLHNTVRMTFHGDARFYAENQRVHLESPVIETFGALELNAKDNAGSNAMITIKTDSLICHDSLIRKGKGKVKFSTWSGLPKDLPIIKLGYSRKAAPFAEYAYDDGGTQKICRKCVDHYKGKVYPPDETPLDTMFVKFGPETEWERQNVMVIDHTVITFLTDSFDHVKGAPVLNARYFVDTTKIRNQVEFWTDKNHERDGHLELISERQMGSKDYAGLYTKHLHLEPIGACGHPTSEMWLPGPALDVITTSTFGGFGIQYTDVHVENGGNLNPGFTSLRLRGQCYEQACGTLTMKDLRLDGGAELHFSVGTTRGLNGEFSDAIDVDKLTTYGPVNVNIEIRPCEEIEKRCYPLIYYKSVSPNSLNTLKLHPATVKIDGEEYPLSLNLGTDGIVYLCVGDAQVMDHHARTVTIPTVAGVKTIPGPGIWEVKSRSSFPFRAVYTGKPLVVRTNRMVNGVQEVLGGVKNANGEYEYIIPHVQQEITLTFGPDVVSNEFLAGAAVWSHGEMIYIRVERADIASIYSVAGQLVKRVDLPEGDTSIPMSRGAYVITLKDGSVHKVIVK